MIKCSHLLELDCFNKIKLVAGKNGINRIVTWVYVVQEVPISPWIYGGEFILASIPVGEKKGLNLQLDALFEECKLKNSSGLLIQGDSFASFEKNYKSLIQKADDTDFPIFWVTRKKKFVDITKEISGLIIKEELKSEKNNAFVTHLINEAACSENDIYSWANTYQVKLQKYFCMVQFYFFPKTSVNTASILPVETVAKDASKVISRLLKDRHIDELSRIEGNCIVYFLNDISPEKVKKSISFFESLQPILESDFENFYAYVAVGRIFDEVKNIRKTYEDTLRISKLFQLKDTDLRVIPYESLGIYRIFFEVSNEKEIISFMKDTLGKLIEYDNKNNAELLKTLSAYLMCNGNLTKTSDDLIVHRNTLLYRIDKIKSILNQNIEDPIVRLSLLSSFMASNLYPLWE